MARTKKFIAHFSEENLAKYPQEVRDLIDKGRQRGFVTQQELMHALPNLEDDIEFADEVYTLLLELGIDLIDVKDRMIWGEKEKKEDILEADIIDEDDLSLLADDVEDLDEDFMGEEEEGKSKKDKKDKKGKAKKEKKKTKKELKA